MGDVASASTDVESAPEINHVAVKPPQFYKRNPESWFRQMESQFALAKITSPITKFHHVMAVLPEDLFAEVVTDEINSYELLKTAILDHLKENKHQLIENALAAMELGDKRPSQLVSEFKRRFNEIGLKADDTLVKSRLLTALPTNLRAALVGHEDQSVEQYAKIADSMLAVAKPSPFVPINTLTQQSTSSSGRNNGYQPKQGQSGKKFNVRPFYPDQRPRVCNAHIFYGSRARTCRAWCQWPSNNKPRILSQHEKTPHQSRSSSPTNS